jgi:hypothetical protein
MQIAKILGSLTMELQNISPFETKYFQPFKNLLWVTKYILETTIHNIYVRKALLFLICQMECPNAFEMYPKVGQKYIIDKSINKTRLQGGI